MKTGQALRKLKREYALFLKRHKRPPTVFNVSKEFYKALTADLWTWNDPGRGIYPNYLLYKTAKVYESHHLRGSNMGVG